MAEAFRLAYVDLATRSLDEALAYYQEVIGARVVRKVGQQAYLSLGLDDHNIALYQESRPRMRSFGLEIRPDLDLKDLQRHLNSLGVEAQFKSDSRPGVAALLGIADVAGFCVELFSGMQGSGSGFAEQGVSPNRIGHLALVTPDPAKLLSFFKDGLGFLETDWFEDSVTFLTCNKDHHVLNIIGAPAVMVHHLAFELRGRDSHFDAADLLARAQRPIVWGPSRHTAGHNLASYHMGADDLLIELYADMDVFLPALNSFEPRPWHDDLPQRPKRWKFSDMTTWKTEFMFDFRKVAWG